MSILKFVGYYQELVRIICCLVVVIIIIIIVIVIDIVIVGISIIIYDNYHDNDYELFEYDSVCVT